MAKKIKGKETRVREVLYPELKVKVHRGDRNTGLDETQAKAHLGWHEEVGEAKFGNDYLFKDRDGKKIRCTFNTLNRPYSHALSELYAQEILNGRWRLNGETMIIGKTGEIIAAQHRLVGLVLAVQDYNKAPENYPFWEEEPTMDCIIIMGIEETDDVVNTVDTGRPRTLADVLYRSPHFKDLGQGARITCSRICDFAIRNVWERTQVNSTPHAPRRTHAEAIEFLDAHPSILKAVRHIYDEDVRDKATGDFSISGYIQPGVAAGFLYLMGMSATVTETYRDAEPRNEKICVKSRWTKAEEFWTSMGKKDKETNAVRLALGDLSADDGELTGGTRLEKIAIIVQAWNLWIGGQKKITSEDVAPSYEDLGEGRHVQIDHPTVGGIDLGTIVPKLDLGPTEEEVEAQKKEEQALKERQEKAKKEPVVLKSREADRRVDKTLPPKGKDKATLGHKEPPAPAIDPSTGFKAPPRLSKEKLNEQREAEAKALDAKANPAKKTPVGKPKGKVPAGKPKK